MNAPPRRWPLIKGFTPVVFSLVCAALMILAAWWKRGAPAGSPLHTTLEWSIQLLVVLVIVGLSCIAAATLIGCSLIRRALDPGPWVRVILALVPMIPVSAMV